MASAFQVRRVGEQWGAPTRRLSAAIRRLRKRCADEGPWRIRKPGSKWHQDLKSVLGRVRDEIDHGPDGTHVVIVSKDSRAAAIRKVFDSKGPDVLKAAVSQLGVPYVWADVDPAGGGSSGFDCSGLVLWCYGQVGVELPHQADAIMRSPQVHTFTEARLLRPGDMVFFDYGRLGPGRADHIGLVTGPGSMIAASSSADRVQRQPIDISHVLRYGYVPAVTGAH